MTARCSSQQRQLTTTSATLSPSQDQEPLAGATEQQEDGAQQGSLLLLNTGAALLPHPDKAYRGGEDWYFVAGHQQAFGVADGVGGWAEVGVDAGAYARSIMEHAKQEAETMHTTGSQLCSQHILEQAYTRVDAQGEPLLRAGSAAAALQPPAGQAASSAAAMHATMHHWMTIHAVPCSWD